MMMLAFNEIKKEKLKYSLFILMVSLLACLILLLAGLSNGLSAGMNGTIHTAEGDFVILSAESEGNVVRSFLPAELGEPFRYIPATDDAALLGHQSTSTYIGDNIVNIALFGFEIDSFAAPKPIIAGKSLSSNSERQVVVDKSLIDQYQLQIGDKLTIKGLAEEVEITGITENKRFSMQPSVFLPLEYWREIRMEGMENLVTLLLIQSPRGVDEQEFKENLQYIAGDDLLVLTKSEAANGVPGVKEMKLIPLFLQWIAFGIVILIVGVFFYILLIQSTHKIVLLKALGASNHYLLKSMFIKMGIIIGIGSTIGFITAYVTHLWMPPSLSLQINWQSILNNGITLVCFSFLSLLFSVWKLIKIPAKMDTHRFY